MPFSSKGFFNGLNTEISQISFTSIDAGKQTEPLLNSIQNSIQQIHYKDINEKDMAYIANIANQNLKKNNAILRKLQYDFNLDEEDKKREYVAYLLRNLYFIKLQKIIYAGYGKGDLDQVEKKAENIQSQIRNLLVYDLQNLKKTHQSKKDLHDISKVILALAQKLWEEIIKLLGELLRTSNWTQFAGDVHLWRITLVFVRITFQEALLPLFYLDFFADLLAKYPNNYAGLDVNLENVLKFITDTKIYFNSLSVAMPALRFLLHLSLLIKHSIGSREEEQLEASTRFWREFKKRYYVLGNDLVWTGINLITNFNDICKISANNALMITVAFMFFDMLWMLPGWYFAFREYQEQIGLLNAELEELTKNPHEHEMVLQELKQLDITWQAKSDSFLYSLMAAGLFTLGFIIAVLVPELAVPAYLLCNFAMALNLLSNDFTLMREHKLTLDLAGKKDPERKILQKEYKMARNNLIVGLIIYTFMPALTMAVFAACWPAAIPLAIAFLAFQVVFPQWKAYQQKSIDNIREKQHDQLVQKLFAEPNNCLVLSEK